MRLTHVSRTYRYLRFIIMLPSERGVGLGVDREAAGSYLAMQQVGSDTQCRSSQ